LTRGLTVVVNLSFENKIIRLSVTFSVVIITLLPLALLSLRIYKPATQR